MLENRDSVVKKVQEILFQKVAFLSQKNTLWVAYSGGVDSHALLHAFSELQTRLGFKLQALHINHQLHREAHQWETHCRQICDELSVPLVVRRIEVKQQKGESLEEKARIIRLEVFKEFLVSPMNFVATAHQEDDQAETLFSRIMRGCGVIGLSGMQPMSSMGAGVLLKPFLQLRRAELLNYAKETHLHWIEDSSNQDVRFDRNLLRHQIFPMLKKRWPGFYRPLLRLAKISEETYELLSEVAEQDLETVKGKVANTLAIKKLTMLSRCRQKNCVRFWIKALGVSPPSYKKLQQVLSEVLMAKADAMPVVEWRGVEIRRYRDILFLLPPRLQHDLTQIIEWNGKDSIQIPSLSITVQKSELSARLCAVLETTHQPITIRFRQGGERCKPIGAPSRRSLKNIFQERGIPPWERTQIPLIYVGNTIAAVLGVCECE
ncbi:MAG: tRNA lysidine(34) synthetase TilS [Gammaproteobacteria bacterium]|nr:tRNA lysidine(34) synthetase TilS [Gammaproteobacteria bacterium]